VCGVSASAGTAMANMRIVTYGLARGDRKWPLNNNPKLSRTRVHVRTRATLESREIGGRRETAGGRSPTVRSP
jgi:hypothetical protein